MRLKGFVGPTYHLESRSASIQRCVNMYPSHLESGNGRDDEEFYLTSAPGLEQVLDFGNVEIRGLYFSVKTGLTYVVAGDTLFRFDASYNLTEILTLDSSQGRVSMADNSVTLVVVDGNDMYTHELDSSLGDLYTGENFRGADVVKYVDGYFVFIKPDSQIFYISRLLSTTLDALDFASSEGSPDKIVSALINRREVWLFGERTTEVFYNSGAADFPFTRIEGSFIELGCTARNASVKAGGSVFWVGRDEDGSAMVYQAEGLRPARVSNNSVEEALAKADVSTCTCFSYQENGHTFVIVNAEGLESSWVYDLATKLWHERAFMNAKGILTRGRAEEHVFTTEHLVSDYAAGLIYRQSKNIYSINKLPMLRMRVSPHYTKNRLRVFFRTFELDFDRGVGLNADVYGADPKVELEFSDNGGRTWSNKLPAGIGKLGDYTARAIWRRLGAGRDRVFRVRFSEPTAFDILGAEVEIGRGNQSG